MRVKLSTDEECETPFLDYDVKSFFISRRFFDYLMEQALKKVLLEYVGAMLNKYVLLVAVCLFVFINRFLNK